MFKKIIVGILCSVVLFGAEIHWAKDYKSGIATAIKEKKPVFFVVSSTKCKYCLLLDKTTLKDSKIIEKINRDYIAIRSWVDKGDFVPMEIAQSTPALPGIWFLYQNGEPMYQPLLGYVKKDILQQVIKLVKDDFDKSNKREKR